MTTSKRSDLPTLLGIREEVVALLKLGLPVIGAQLAVISMNFVEHRHGRQAQPSRACGSRGRRQLLDDGRDLRRGLPAGGYCVGRPTCSVPVNGRASVGSFVNRSG